MSLVTTISSSALKVGKHKIPKYLYHITPTKNVENIQKKGLQMTEDDLFGEGVFMFDLANLTKFWTKTNNKQKTNFAQTLIDYVTRRSGNSSISIFNKLNSSKDLIISFNLSSMLRLIKIKIPSVL